MILNFHKLQYLLGFLSNERYVNLGEKTRATQYALKMTEHYIVIIMHNNIRNKNCTLIL